MRRSIPTWPVAIAAALLAVACGAGLDGGDDGSYPDGGVPGDGGGPDAPLPPPCLGRLDFEPAQPVAGAHNEVVARIPEPLEVLDWQVLGPDGRPRPFQLADADRAAIRFVVDQPGDYTIFANSGCLFPLAVAGDGTIFKLRMVPTMTEQVPPQERDLALPGDVLSASGYDYTLERGNLAEGVVVDSAQAPVAAYVRATPIDHEDLSVETFTDASGRFAARVLSGEHDLLVVPQATGDRELAPFRIGQWTWEQATTIEVPASDPISGFVEDLAGDRLVGATVMLRIDGVPTTVDTTDGNGAFTVRGHIAADGSPATLTVVPPYDLGLPRLEAAMTVHAGRELAIRYRPSLVVRPVSGVVVRAYDRAASQYVAGAARVTFAGTIPVAADVDDGGGGKVVHASGEVLVEVEAGADGAVPPFLLPAVAGLSAVIDPVRGNLAVVALGAGGAVPSLLDAALEVPIHVHAIDDAEHGLPGIQVRAIPKGALAAASLTVPSYATNASGNVAVPLAPGGSYDLLVIDPRSTHGGAQREHVVTGEAFEDFILPGATPVAGQLSTPERQPVARAVVSLFCKYCSGPQSVRPLVRVLSNDSGAYQLPVPRPTAAPARARARR